MRFNYRLVHHAPDPGLFASSLLPVDLLSPVLKNPYAHMPASLCSLCFYAAPNSKLDSVALGIYHEESNHICELYRFY